MPYTGRHLTDIAFIPSSQNSVVSTEPMNIAILEWQSHHSFTLTIFHYQIRGKVFNVVIRVVLQRLKTSRKETVPIYSSTRSWRLLYQSDSGKNRNMFHTKCALVVCHVWRGPEPTCVEKWWDWKNVNVNVNSHLYCAPYSTINDRRHIT